MNAAADRSYDGEVSASTTSGACTLHRETAPRYGEAEACGRAAESIARERTRLDPGVLTTIVGWAGRARNPKRGRLRARDLYLHAGGLDGSSSDGGEFQDWADRKLRVADEITVRIRAASRFDPPASRRREDPSEEERRRRAYYEERKAEYERRPSN